MTQRVNSFLCNGGLAANGALLALRQTRFSTGRGNRSNGLLGMTQRINNFLCNDSLVADRALLALGQTCIGAVRCNCGQSLLGMSQRCNRCIGVSMRCIVLTGMSGVTSFSTGGLSYNRFIIVAQRCDFLSIRVLATVTSDGLYAGSFTGCGSGNFLYVGTFCIGMLTSPDTLNGLICHGTLIITRIDGRTIGILQKGRGDRDLKPLISFVVRTSILYLIGDRLRAWLHDDGAGAADIRAALSGIDITCGQVCRAVDFHIGVIRSAGYVLGRCRITQINMRGIRRTAEGSTFLRIKRAFRYPFIIVVDINLVAASKGTACAFFKNQLCTGQQGDVLSHVDGTAAVHGNGNIAVDGQDIILGIDRLGTSQTKIHFYRQALDADFSIDIDLQTAGVFIIILDNRAAVDIKHAIGTNEGNRSTLNTYKRNSNGHVAIFSRASFQSHGNFHILHVILGEREYTPAVTDHAGGIIATSPVHNLEALINSTAALNGHRTLALNIAPCIQITALIDGDAAARVHLDKAASADRAALTAARSLRSRQAYRAVYDNVRAFRHGQLAIHGGSCISSVHCRRCRGAQRIRIIVGNQQGDAAGNGVVARRQGAVVHENNCRVACGFCHISSFVQIAVDQIAIHKEVGNVAAHERLDSRICRGLDDISLLLGQELVVLVHPAEEGAAGSGQGHAIGCSHSRDGHGGGAFSIHRRAFHRRRDRTLGRGIFHSDREGLRCGGESDIRQHQLVLSGISTGGHGDLKILACFQRSAVAAHAAEICAGIILDTVDVRHRHGKGHNAGFSGSVGDVQIHGTGRARTAAAAVFTFDCCSNGRAGGADTCVAAGSGKLDAVHGALCFHHHFILTLNHFAVAQAQLSVDFVKQNLLLLFGQLLALLNKLVLLGQGSLCRFVAFVVAVGIQQQLIGHIRSDSQLFNVRRDLRTQRLDGNGVFRRLHSGFLSRLYSGLNSRFYSGFLSRLYSGLNSGFLSRLYSRLYSRLNSRFRSRFYSRLYSRLYSGFYSRLNSRFLSRLNSRFLSRLHSGFLSRLYSGLNSGFYSRFCSGLNSRFCSGFYSRFCSGFYSRFCSGFYSRFCSGLNSRFYSRFCSGLNSRFLSGFLSRLYSGLNSRFLSRLYSRLHSGLLSRLNSRFRSRLNSRFNSRFLSGFYSRFLSRLCSRLNSGLNSRFCSGLSSRLNSGLFGELLNQFFNDFTESPINSILIKPLRHISRQLTGFLFNFFNFFGNLFQFFRIQQAYLGGNLFRGHLVNQYVNFLGSQLFFLIQLRIFSKLRTEILHKQIVNLLMNLTEKDFLLSGLLYGHRSRLRSRFRRRFRCGLRSRFRRRFRRGLRRRFRSRFQRGLRRRFRSRFRRGLRRRFRSRLRRGLRSRFRRGLRRWFRSRLPRRFRRRFRRGLRRGFRRGFRRRFRCRFRRRFRRGFRCRFRRGFRRRFRRRFRRGFRCRFRRRFRSRLSNSLSDFSFTKRYLFISDFFRENPGGAYGEQHDEHEHLRNKPFPIKHWTSILLS